MPSLFKEEDLQASINKHFGKIEDQRVGLRRLHPLVDIIVVTLFAVISGADSWVGIKSMDGQRNCSSNFWGCPTICSGEGF
jgi:hypothetical protein